MAERILIADDERDITDMLARFFRERGYEVLSAYNGAEAVRLAGARPDLILLDINMPDLDGLEVCKSRLRASRCMSSLSRRDLPHRRDLRS